MTTLYLDDLLEAGSDITAFTPMKRTLTERLDSQDCVEARFCLRMEIVLYYKPQTLKLCQRSYGDNVLQRFGMDERKAVCTPMQSQVESDAPHDSLMNKNLYRNARGSIMYLMGCTRPDICFAVGCWSQ